MIRDCVIIAITSVFGFWLTTVFAALKSISWGSIRKLDPKKDKALIIQAEAWIERRDRYRILLRLVVLMNLAVLAWTVCDLCVRAFEQALILPWGPIAIAAATACVFSIMTEALSVWMSTHTWAILRSSMPLVRFLNIAFFIPTWPAVIVYEQMERRRESEDEEDKTTTEDEIEALLEHDAHARDEEEDSGIEESTGKMIRGVLNLDETLVKEIMTPRVDIIGVEICTPLAEVRRNIVESGHSRIPVYKGNVDDIVGVIYSKNMLDDENIKAKTSVSDIMHHPVYIPETKDVDELLQEFKQRKVHIAVVIDEYGGTAGIVTLEDILEEIVGEIADEFDDEDDEEVSLKPADDGSIEVEGRTPIDDLNEVLDLSISEEEDNVTIGGFITTQIGRIPKSGEQVRLDEFAAEIVEADGRKIDRLIIRKIDVEVAEKEEVG